MILQAWPGKNHPLLGFSHPVTCDDPVQTGIRDHPFLSFFLLFCSLRIFPAGIAFPRLCGLLQFIAFLWVLVGILHSLVCVA